ncbi:MAG: aminotransferase class III-fold pyridoxal phosphate-dependent enzyme [Myxococcota bacterium]
MSTSFALIRVVSRCARISGSPTRVLTGSRSCTIARSRSGPRHTLSRPLSGFQHAGLDPDLVCLAKALGGGVPVGALAFRAAQVDLGGGAHGSTFGGNPLSCAAAAAVAVLDAIEGEGLVVRANQWGRELRDRLLNDLAPGPGARGVDVRGRGLMVGIELNGSAVPVQRALQDRGFLVLGIRTRDSRRSIACASFIGESPRSTPRRGNTAARSSCRLGGGAALRWSVRVLA